MNFVKKQVKIRHLTVGKEFVERGGESLHQRGGKRSRRLKGRAKRQDNQGRKQNRKVTQK